MIGIGGSGSALPHHGVPVRNLLKPRSPRKHCGIPWSSWANRSCRALLSSPIKPSPNVLEWPVPPASSTYNIRTHQEQYYSAKALSWCSTAGLVFNDPPLMLQGVFEPFGRPLVSNGETRPEAYWRNCRRLAGAR
jgi:hypothetical protein